MTLTEAAACGTPSVATNVAGHCDAVIDGRSGLLCDDPAAMTEALRAVLTDTSLRDRLQRGALERAQELTWERAAATVFAPLVEFRGR
jgi:glycosyltransferase involved in cell wall biosynthesis